MRLVANGPDVPDRVLRYHEDGKLVLFCGAGVSMNNGLPDYPGLVDAVQEEYATSDELLAHVKTADKKLKLLETIYRPADVRKVVIEALQVPDDPDLSTHRALIDLSICFSKRHDQDIKGTKHHCSRCQSQPSGMAWFICMVE